MAKRQPQSGAAPDLASRAEPLALPLSPRAVCPAHANSEAAPLPEADPNAGIAPPNRRQLPSLMALRPYLARHLGMVLVALIALVASAGAMLTVPIAVRRMIDVGFAAHDGVFIDRYFVTLIGIGLVLAVASAGRMYAVNWLGERVVADLRSDVFRHLATLGPPSTTARTPAR